MEKKLISILCVVSVAFASACASSPKRSPPSAYPGGEVPTSPNPANPDTGVAGPPEPFGPQPAPPPQTYGPEPIEYRAITLVVGPGLARAFAAAGALKALQEAKIPIATIVATETSALIATLFVMTKSVNEFEFALLKLKDDTFLKGGLLPNLFGGGASDGSRLKDALEQLVGARELTEARIPLRIAVLRAGKTELLDRGSAAQAVMDSMTVPGFMKPSDDASAPTSTGATEPYPISEARRLAPGPVIVIDAVDSSAQAASPQNQKKRDPALNTYLAGAKKHAIQDAKEADLVIRPDLRGVDALDFPRRTDAMFKGKTAVIAKMNEIRHLVGMPAGQR